MAYVKEALGTNGNGITLGPPVSVGPMAYGNFVKELEAEKGPFVFFTFEEIQRSTYPLPFNGVEPRRFLAWLTIYDPNALAYISKVMLLKGMTEKKPTWIEEGKIRFKQSDYNLYLASIQRVKGIVADQGLVKVDELDQKNFIDWWTKHDRAGMAAFIVIEVLKGTAPTQLFEFWKVNKGIAPPRGLLGFGLWNMMKRNWFWLGAGAVGGAVGYKLLQRRRLERAKTMMANSDCCGCE